MPSNWLNKIVNHKVDPPPEAWVNITNELDKDITNSLKAKLLAHEETPPADVLESIFNTLDKEDMQTAPAFIEKIRNYSPQAPAGSWDDIITKLDTAENQLFLLNPKKKNVKAIFIKIAAAAAIITVFLITVLPTTKHSQTEINTVAAVKDQTATGHATQNSIKNTGAPVPDTRKDDSAYTHAGEKTINQPAGTYSQDYVAGKKTVDLAQAPGVNEKLQNNKGETPMDIALMNTPNTYISITGADGQTVKVSSKFSNLISYLNDKNPDNRENIDIIIDEAPRWKKIFTEWRNKMTNNTVAPSLSNFMDIIELSKILEDKNN